MAQQYLWPPSAAQISGTVPISGTVTVANEITGTIASITNIVGGTVAIQTGTLASITNIAGGTITIPPISGTVAVSGTPTFAGGALISSGSTTSGTGVLVTGDVSAYSGISAQIVITGTAQVTFECSNDNATFVSVVLGYITGSGAPTSVASSSNLFFGPISYRYFRVRCNSWVSGTVSAFVVGGVAAQSDPGLRAVSVSNVVSVSGSLTSISGGTIAINTGTIASITNVAAGTIAINTGTIASITNVAGGTVAVSTGTIASITNLAGGTVSTSVVVSSTASNTQVAGNGTVTTILAANASRKSFAVSNNSSGTCFLCLGTVATTQVFTVAIPPNGYYEQPNLFVFTGSVTAIWSSSVGSASITEFK